MTDTILVIVASGVLGYSSIPALYFMAVYLGWIRCVHLYQDPPSCTRCGAEVKDCNE